MAITENEYRPNDIIVTVVVVVVVTVMILITEVLLIVTTKRIKFGFEDSYPTARQRTY